MNDNGDLPTGWFGHKGGASTPWANVEAFWNAATSTTQPCGIPHVTTTLVSSLLSSQINNIYDEDIIQIRRNPQSMTGFHHGLFVDYNQHTGSTNDLYVSSHSDQRYFNKLSDVILAHGGGTKVNLRALVPFSSDLTK
ncbi:MAG: amidase domain-containing protein [Coriobacteriales bacterium]|jgi:hypothetical protein|nr:amidase domain-containing protein [Coriobacteriales bacterium]